MKYTRKKYSLENLHTAPRKARNFTEKELQEKFRINGFTPHVVISSESPDIFFVHNGLQAVIKKHAVESEIQSLIDTQINRLVQEKQDARDRIMSENNKRRDLLNIRV